MLATVKRCSAGEAFANWVASMNWASMREYVPDIKPNYFTHKVIPKPQGEKGQGARATL